MPNPMPRTLTGYDRRALRLAVGFVTLAACSPFIGCSSSRPVASPLLPRVAEAATPDAPDVALLKSCDFVARSHAAERLVAGGAASLPALGRAGDLAAPGPGTSAESTTRPVIDAIVARLSAAEVESLLGSPYPVLRRGAADELGRRGDWAAVPRLIERLEDREPQVRDAAHAALRRLTNEFLDAGDPRTLASTSLAERWRTWWRQEGRARASMASTQSG
jgi:hypothetical protein